MADIQCAECRFRAKYDNNPKSFLGRLWRWHIKWCPGWTAYMKSLPQEERDRIEEKYQYKN